MSIDRGAIETQLNAIGEGAQWWEQREFRDLPYILDDDERIHGLVRGIVLGKRRPRLPMLGDWLIVATDRRLLCLRDERFGRKQIDIPLGHIVSLQHGTRIFAIQVVVATPDRRYRLRIRKDDAFRFLSALNPLVPRPRPSVSRFGLPALLNAAGLQSLQGLPALAALPSPEYATRAEFTRLEGTVERLEGEVERLQQQVNFLENLLHQRAGREIQGGQRIGGSNAYAPAPVSRGDTPSAGAGNAHSPSGGADPAVRAAAPAAGAAAQPATDRADAPAGVAPADT